MRKLLSAAVATALAALCQTNAFALEDTAEQYSTATPIKHLVVIFQENVSFDHYFGTYPNALNLAGEPPFVAAKDTATVNGLTGALLTRNATSTNSANGAGATNPFRLSPAQASTADQDHDYTPEQQALHGGVLAQRRDHEFAGARHGLRNRPGFPGDGPLFQQLNGLLHRVLCLPSRH